MKHPWIVRALVAVVLAFAAWWVHENTTWEEVDEDVPASGAAATDPHYALRPVLQAAGSSLSTQAGLEPLPPTSATLVLDARFWDIFPGRDARLRAWVEAGGHLVVGSSQLDDPAHLRWVPILLPDSASATQRRRAAAETGPASAPVDDDEDADTDAEDAPASAPAPTAPRSAAARAVAEECDEDYFETPGSRPAFEPGHRYRGCIVSQHMRPRKGVTATWELLDQDRTIALRVPVGRGTVTCFSSWAAARGLKSRAIDQLAALLSNRRLVLMGHGEIAVAFLDARPGRAVWLVDEEKGEALPVWLWNHARAPLLLALGAVALALWRLMVRFGPREAPPARSRRSMGEQVRGTGEFLAASDPRALHAATRRAFDEALRTRVEIQPDMTDAERVQALAARLAPAHAVDAQALLAALNPGPRSSIAQWLAAIALLEHTRRALVRATGGAPSPD